MKKRLIKAVDIDNIHISDEDFKSVAEKYIKPKKKKIS